MISNVLQMWGVASSSLAELELLRYKKEVNQS